ncbi:MAG TPA: 50S ribosomal protein L9 [Casimicrobiaceae bacterium]|nr:50S ribosomal protein L9 [Casimicrobiaceae bacterium]
MQIILLEKVANVGDLGQVVKVKAGYARNFLIPKGMAKRATPENLKLLEERRSELEKVAADKLAAAQGVAETLEGTTVRVVQKAGVDGRLFGSVGGHDLVEALRAQGVTIEKSQVRMPSGPIKQVGEHPVTIALHTDVVAHVTVNVVGDTVTQ